MTSHSERHPARELALRLTRVLGQHLSGAAPADTADRLRRLAAWIDSGTPARKGKGSNFDAIKAVFEHWRSAMNRPTAKLTSDRKSVISARLRDGYSVQDCCAAIDALAQSKFHRGENDAGKRYDDLRYALKDGSTLERWRDGDTTAESDAAAELRRMRNG